MLERLSYEKKILYREQKYRNLFEKAVDTIYLIDPATAKIIDANQMASQMLGYTKKQLQCMTIIDIDHHTSITEAVNWASEFIANNQPTHFERSHFTKEGSFIPVEINANIVDIDGGKLIQAYVRDIGPRKQLEEQLLQSQKMQAIGTLAGGIAHDFNNILMSISGLSESGLIESKNKKVSRRLKNILKFSQRAQKLISKILTFSRKAPKQMETVTLAGVINESISFLHASFSPLSTVISQTPIVKNTVIQPN